MTHIDELKIEVCFERPPQVAANTFNHEVLHAIHNVQSVGDSDEEERFTNSTANGLTQFMLDNPDAWVWWQDTALSACRGG